MSHLPIATVTGLILAGGAGKRMGGVDKGWVCHQGVPMIEAALARLTPQVGSILISANRSLERYAALGHPVVQDNSSDFQGPLAGILAGLSACQTPWLQVIPCDTPAFPSDLVQQLLAAVRHQACTPVVRGREQWTFTLLHRDCLLPLQQQFDQGVRTLGKALSALQLDLLPIEAENRQDFININTLAE
ncbi:MAG: molybdenum cofactor guanylyltransferase [Burkholderiaceae bacterium]|nr:MAG: molybdenum cofactor guanylyltransferase [Burkholderiaceae bacterium]